MMTQAYPSSSVSSYLCGVRENTESWGKKGRIGKRKSQPFFFLIGRVFTSNQSDFETEWALSEGATVLCCAGSAVSSRCHCGRCIDRCIGNRRGVVLARVAVSPLRGRAFMSEAHHLLLTVHPLCPSVGPSVRRRHRRRCRQAEPARLW